MNAPLPEAEFYWRMAYYRYHAEFDVNEREYKLRLANNLRTAREQLDLNDSWSAGRIVPRQNRVANLWTELTALDR